VIFNIRSSDEVGFVQVVKSSRLCDKRDAYATLVTQARHAYSMLIFLRFCVEKYAIHYRNEAQGEYGADAEAKNDDTCHTVK